MATAKPIRLSGAQQMANSTKTTNMVMKFRKSLGLMRGLSSVFTLRRTWIMKTENRNYTVNDARRLLFLSASLNPILKTRNNITRMYSMGHRYHHIQPVKGSQTPILPDLCSVYILF